MLCWSYHSISAGNEERETDSDIRGKSFDERDCLLPEHATLSLPHSPPNLVNKYLSD